MSKSTLKTKDETMRDLQTILHAFLTQLDRILGAHEHVLGLVGRKSDNIIMRFIPDDSTDSTQLDISETEAAFYIGRLYDFAAEGRLETQLKHLWLTVEEDIEAFFRGLVDFPLVTNNADHFPLQTVLQVLDVARARRMLDEGGYVVGSDGDSAWGYMQLRDVALLAGIDEKTARNLAHPQASNRLVTTKWKGRTLVEIEFARQWLANRGFKETVEFDVMLERDLDRNGFSDVHALGDFVEKHRERLGLERQELAARAGLGSDGEHWLKQLERGLPSFDANRLSALGRTFGIQVKPFLIAALKVAQAAELARLQADLAELDSTIENSPTSAS